MAVAGASIQPALPVGRQSKLKLDPHKVLAAFTCRQRHGNQTVLRGTFAIDLIRNQQPQRKAQIFTTRLPETKRLFTFKKKLLKPLRVDLACRTVCPRSSQRQHAPSPSNHLAVGRTLGGSTHPRLLGRYCLHCSTPARTAATYRKYAQQGGILGSTETALPKGIQKRSSRCTQILNRYCAALHNVTYLKEGELQHIRTI